MELMDYHSKKLIQELLSLEIQDANAQLRVNSHLMGSELVKKRLEDLQKAQRVMNDLPVGQVVCKECHRGFFNMDDIYNLNNVID
jgi:ubiquinone biosynthesis protein Coq4